MLVSSWGTVLGSTSMMSLSEPQCAGLHSGWSLAAFSRGLSAGRVGGDGRWDRRPSLHPGVLSCMASLGHLAGRRCAQGLGKHQNVLTRGSVPFIPCSPRLPPLTGVPQKMQQVR